MPTKHDTSVSKAGKTSPERPSLPATPSADDDLRVTGALADEYISRLVANPKDRDLNLSNYVSKLVHEENQLVDFAYDVHSRLIKILEPPGPDEGDRTDEHKVARRLWEAQALCKMLAAYSPDIEDALNDSVALNQCSLDVQNAANAIGVLLAEADSTYHELDIEPRSLPAVTEGSAE